MTNLYDANLVTLLETVWGDGFLSPGGPPEIARLLAGHDLTGQTVLDIGCGAGGIDICLVRDHGAGYVTGLDVEDGVLDHARERVAAAGLGHRIGLVKVAPGPLPFGPAVLIWCFPRIPSSISLTNMP